MSYWHEYPALSLQEYFGHPQIGTLWFWYHKLEKIFTKTILHQWDSGVDNMTLDLVSMWSTTVVYVAYPVAKNCEDKKVSWGVKKAAK